MIYEASREILSNFSFLVTLVARFGPFIFLIIVILRSVTSYAVLPGVPKFPGLPILGTIPICLRYGVPELLDRLINTGDQGISQTRIAGKVIVSIQGPALVKELLSLPAETVSR
jgi:hypothetical protein